MISAVSLGVGLGTSSSTTRMIAGVATGASSGVAIGKFVEINDIKSAGVFTLDLISQIANGVNNFLAENNEIPEFTNFKNRVKELSGEITEKAENLKQSKRWYHSTGLLILWIVIFWPVGVYGIIQRIRKK